MYMSEDIITSRRPRLHIVHALQKPAHKQHRALPCIIATSSELLREVPLEKFEVHTRAWNIFYRVFHK